MIDRYTIIADQKQLPLVFDYLAHVPDFEAQYNAAPSKRMPITTLDQPDLVQLFQWGFISVLSNNKKMSPKLFNNHFEKGLSKPSIKKSLSSRRCIIYASGFFLWKQVSKKKLIPYYAHMLEQELFTIGGFWEERDEFIEDSQDSFMMLTQNSIRELEEFQDDMPFIIPKGKIKDWLNPDFEPEDALNWQVSNTDSSWSVYPVAPFINQLERNDDRLIERSIPSDQHGNYTLFG
jgi:putative SOS response-associated peptidase YedK